MTVSVPDRMSTRCDSPARTCNDICGRHNYGYVEHMGCDIHVILERAASDGQWSGELVRFGRDYAFFAAIAGQSMRGIPPLPSFTPAPGWPDGMSPEAYNMGYIAVQPPDHVDDEDDDEEWSWTNGRCTVRSLAEQWSASGDHWARRLGNGTVVYSQAMTLPGGGWRISDPDLHTWVWLDADAIHALARALDARRMSGGQLWLPDGVTPTENDKPIAGAVRSDQTGTRSPRSLIEEHDRGEAFDGALYIVYTAVADVRRGHGSVDIEEEIPVVMWDIPERAQARSEFATMADGLPCDGVRMLVAFDN